MEQNSLLLVIPTVAECGPCSVRIDLDFSNNLEAYLREFSSVTVMCPSNNGQAFPAMRPFDSVVGNDRARIIFLPEPYREDRYLINRAPVSRLLKEEIERARYILISPHAPFDWSTLAAEICISTGRRFNMEADWNLPFTSRYLWGEMPWGLNKLRKYFWIVYHNRKYWRCLRKSSLALVQGEDVYNEYRQIAPNAFSVLNVQITEKDRISEPELEEKIRRASSAAPLSIVYAGRAIDMKGPKFWLKTLAILAERGVDFRATWFGDGQLLSSMRAFVKENGLDDVCCLPGSVPRPQILSALRKADLFLFCHMTKESPRCLVEALASAAPIIGFGTDYSRSLVRDLGGGDFAKLGDIEELACLVQGYAEDRPKLANLIQDAFESSKSLDREREIERRIGLMKRFL